MLKFKKTVTINSAHAMKSEMKIALKSPNSVTSVCCRFVVQQVVGLQIHNKSK